MKGIILSAGKGSRLYPITEGVGKALLPVYDKPMIYYPIATLMTAGIKDILIITNESDLNNFKRLLGDGTKFGINLSYEIQEKPEGIAQAFTIGEKFIENDSCALILGDNLFFGGDLSNLFENAIKNTYENRATIFGIHVNDPERFGIAEVNEKNEVISVEEKPTNPKSNIAITGLYFYPSNVVEKAKIIKPSARGELEITSVNELYLKENKLSINVFDESFLWFDTGTFESMHNASVAVKEYQEEKDRIVACLEEIALDNDWICSDKVRIRYNELKSNSYGSYLKRKIN